MKKILSCLLGFTLMTGCTQSLALLGPTSTAATGGNIAQSALSSAVNYSVKKQTGKSPMEHAIAYAEENQIPVSKDKIGEAPFSVDANILHTSSEGKIIID